MQEGNSLVTRAPAVLVVLRVEHRLSAGRDVDDKCLNLHVVVPEGALEIDRLHDAPGPCAELPRRSPALPRARPPPPAHTSRRAPHRRPPCASTRRRLRSAAVRAARPHGGSSPCTRSSSGSHDGNTTSAREPVKSKLPCNSSRTSALTIESPVPAMAPFTPTPSSAIA